MDQDAKRPFSEPTITEEASLAEVTLHSGGGSPEVFLGGDTGTYV
jgi:hypothetical protein